MTDRSGSNNSSSVAQGQSDRGTFQALRLPSQHRNSVLSAYSSALVSSCVTGGSENLYRSIASTLRATQENCEHKDEKGIVAWASFAYGVAVTAPFNFITLTLPFFEA